MNCLKTAGSTLLALSLLAPASAVYSQSLFATGFEAPDYANGSQLSGQNGWFAPSPANPPGYPFDLNPQAAIISSILPRSGMQSVQVQGADLHTDATILAVTGGYYNAIGSYRQTVAYNAGTQGVTIVQADLRLNGALTPGTDFFSAALASVGTGGAGLGEMKISSSGNVYAYTGDDAVPTFLFSAPISLNAWHTLAIEDNFGADTSTFFVDGSELGSVGFVSDYNNDNTLQRGSLLAYAGQDGPYAKADYTAYFDNVRIAAVPEPGAYAVFTSLGLTAAACLRRKRAR
jgi:hypothetical protein